MRNKKEKYGKIEIFFTRACDTRFNFTYRELGDHEVVKISPMWRTIYFSIVWVKHVGASFECVKLNFTHSTIQLYALKTIRVDVFYTYYGKKYYLLHRRVASKGVDIPSFCTICYSKHLLQDQVGISRKALLKTSEVYSGLTFNKSVNYSKSK